MMTPYRHLRVIAPQSGDAFCPWCVHHVIDDSQNKCVAPIVTPYGIVRPLPRWCQQRNPDGTCSDYRPSLWTRFLRLFGRRKAGTYA
jgi:hypothetical protein